MNSNCTLYDVLDKYSIVFQNELGMVKEVTANVCVNRNAALKFCKAIAFPFSLVSKI